MKFLLIFLVILLSRPVFAEEDAEHVVVQVRFQELVTDLGSNAGAREGVKVDVYRRLSVVHPIDKTVIEDRFLIGTIRLQQVSDMLSISRDIDELSYPPKVGDFIVLHTEATPWPEMTEVDSNLPDVRFAEATFRRTLGRALPDRIELWDEFLSRYPQSDLAETIAAERDWLETRMAEERQLRDQVARSDEERLALEKQKKSARGVTVAPESVWLGEPFAVTAVFERVDRVERVRLLVRQKSSPLYETFDMVPNGDSSFVATLPESLAVQATTLVYFVEAIRKDSEVEKVGPSKVVRVRSRPRDPEPRKDRSKARVTGEFVDFKSGPGVDQYWKTEGEFRYQMDGFLDSFAVGAGIFRGEGTSVERIRLDEPSEALGLGYGFAEGRFRILPVLDVGLTALFGNRQGSNLPTFTSTLGLRGDVRLGRSDGTNLALGGSLIGGLGVESWLNLELREVHRVPMRAQVVVTNLPVGRDLGVSLKYAIGYEIFEQFEVLGQVGWNARTIRHYGVGAGLSVSYAW